MPVLQWNMPNVHAGKCLYPPFCIWQGEGSPQKLSKNKKTSSKVLMLSKRKKKNPKSKEMCWCMKCHHQTDFQIATRQASWTEEATSFAPWIKTCSTYATRKILKT